ncbi:cysteine-rich RLK (RECEPTOR-like protein kinase) 8, partial [Striga hermonthica]
METSLPEPVNMLKTIESTIKKDKSVLYIGSSSKSKAEISKKRKKKGKVPVSNKKANNNKGNNKVNLKSNQECYHCGKNGHWKRNCKEYLASLKSSGIYFVEVNLSVNDSSWVLDTGCGSHICNELQMMARSRKLEHDETILRTGNGARVAALAVGTVNLVMNGGNCLSLNNCLYVPEIIKNIISIPVLDREGYKFVIGKGKCSIFQDTSFIYSGNLTNGLYTISPQRNILTIQQNKRKIDNHSSFTLWHARLGHISEKRIHKLGLKLNLRGEDKLPTCESYRGGEYLTNEFLDYLKDNGILSQWTPPGTPQLNGVSERRNRTLLDMVRSMMSSTTLPLSFWGYALETAAHILNRVLSKVVPNIPYEIWYGKTPYMKIWGCDAYVKQQVGVKLDMRSILCKFVGYLKESIGYYFYDPSEQKVFVSRNAVFLEEEVLSKENNEIIELNEEPQIIPQIDTDNIQVETGQSETQPLRRSMRVSKVSDRLYLLLKNNEEGLLLDNDPISYEEAMLDIDSKKWQEAMQSEMDSMYSNKVWTLVDPPEGIVPIGCKWVYKRKLGVDGEVGTYKARLVAKGYTQKQGIDYEETFSPVAMLKSIRILLAIAAYYDYEIWQKDVKA